MVTCKESMGDANEYQKLLEPPPKLEKIGDSKKMNQYAVNAKNQVVPKNVATRTQKTQTIRLKEKKEIQVNEVSTQSKTFEN